MKLKKLVLTFSVFIFVANNSLCMQEKFVKEVVFEKETEKKLVTKGQKLTDYFARYVKKAALSETEVLEFLEKGIGNSIDYCLEKAEKSIDDISGELKKELPEDSILNSALQIPVISGFFSWACKKITACFFDFTAIEKEKKNIKREAIETFRNCLLKDIFLEEKKEKKCVWFDNKIDFIKDQDGNLKVKFLGVEYSTFEDFEKANKKTVYELMCFATTFAAKNKEFFINALKKAKVNERLHKVFYNQISGKIAEIEEKVKGHVFGRELATKELIKN